ncbi:ATP-grasp domain-containing protein [Magnetofaba australis]|uniref:Putative ATP-grasp enzyme-like protein n=1 Tax=Magnetofaba australis IT-1 TaxID=1434232 RepID=A0A1Y2K9E8_9PROT|nr:ATP-grasp domain-containing protein [Magnetofaba australis]OSM07117.1 putative ATP-grasp enzyme-like protein [Magnetofaba australis IT-1]
MTTPAATLFISDHAPRHAQVMIHQYRAHGYRVVGASARASDSFFHHLDARIPAALDYDDDPDPQLWLQRLAAHGVDAIVPVSIAASRYFSRHAQAFLDAGVGLLLPPHETWAMLHDKQQSADFADSVGVRTPRTVAVRQADAGARIAEAGLSYPVVVKTIQEGGAKFVRYAHSAEQAHDIIAEFAQRNPMAVARGVIAQEYIDGQGCGYFALARDGEILSEFCHLRIRENPPSGGVSASCESYAHPKLIAAGRKLVQGSRYSGVCMCEFKYMPAEDEFCLIEINPKFWGSMLLSVSCGVNFPLNYVRAALGQPIPATPYDAGRRVQFVASDLATALRHRHRVGDVVSDLLDPAVTKDSFFLGISWYLRYMLGLFRR